MSTRIGGILMLLTLFTTSCVQRINFDIIRGGGQLIINGSITDEVGEQELQLGFTAFSARIPEPVMGATVTIFDDQGNSEQYFEVGRSRPGIYILAGEVVTGEIGRTYFLEIVMADGRTYRSIPEKMPEQPGNIQNLDYNFSVEEVVSDAIIVSEETFINVTLDADFSGEHKEPYFVRWDVEEVYLLTPTDFPDPFGNIPPPCFVYVYTSAGSINLFDGGDRPRVRLEGLQVARQEVDITFLEKHYFTVFQRSITREAHEYWKKVDQLLSNAGTIFDIPPAPIPGNIYNVDDPEEEVLGYFGAASTTLERFRTFRSDIPLQFVLECEYTPNKRRSEYPMRCLDCLSVRNSTHERPDFF